MKRIIFILPLLIALTLTLSSQPKSVIDIFNKYSGKEGFTSIDLNDPSDMLPEGTLKGEKQGLKKILEKTKGIKILTYSQKGNTPSPVGIEFSNDLKKMFPIEGFKEFLSVNEDGKLVKMLNKKGTKDDQNEFILVVTGEKESVLIWMQGNLSTKDIDKLDKIYK